LYTGFAFLIIGFSIILLAGYEFKKKGKAPKGKSIVHTTSLVDTGIYSVIRHPQYFGFILVVYGLVLISQHWISIISGTAGIALFYLDIVKEEEMSIVKFGEEYTHYMKRVPRLNFFIGILRWIKGKRKTGLQILWFN
jgi:protein-S-isoprenylcysteine O-methyltransferase Ste14